MSKSIIINVVVFAVGASLGFLIGKKTYEGFYAAIAQEEIDSVKEAFENRKPIESARSSKFDDIREANKEINEKEKRTGPNSGLVRSSLDDNPNERAKRNYQLGNSKNYEKTKTPDKKEETDDEDEEDDGPETDAAGKSEEEMAITKVDRTQPYVIDDVEFQEEFNHHDKVSLYYYSVDDVLAGEDDEIIDDIEETVGYDAMNMLDTQTTVWVRNEPLCIDYEIVCIHKSYAEAVQGINISRPLSPREEYARKQKERENREK